MMNERTLALSIGCGIAIGLVMALEATELPKINQMTREQLIENHRAAIRMGVETDEHKFPDRSHLFAH